MGVSLFTTRRFLRGFKTSFVVLAVQTLLKLVLHEKNQALCISGLGFEWGLFLGSH